LKEEKMTSPYDYAAEHFERFKAELRDWVTIPSISTEPTRRGDVRKAAEWLAEDMRRIGLNNVAIMETDGHPVVYGDWLGAGDAPTVLVYGHYDVQPAVMEDGWDSDPFTAVERENILFARGSTDDKGQVMIQAKAAEALLKTGSCPVNLKYLIEGEEEIGSPNLAKFVEQNKGLLAADICLISDTGVQSEEQPLLVYSLRGLMGLTLVVSGPKRDLHSGGYGGMVHNPAQAISEIISKLHDETGRVTVPGFYDDVLNLSEEERSVLAKADMPQDQWEEVMGDLPVWGEEGYRRIEKTGARPTLEINGVASGYAGEGFKTVLPARAVAKISCRLVANQDPYDIYRKVRDYILSIAPNTVHVEISEENHGFPALTPIDHPSVQAAVRAYRAHFPNEPLLYRGGGSIPVVPDIQRILNVPVVLLGFGLPDSQAHGPNESFHYSMYRVGIDTVISYMNELVTSNG
jgi:acetylornithine deacetylase/succinyl-diaminopimelate desuccinylase-like protein